MKRKLVMINASLFAGYAVSVLPQETILRIFHFLSREPDLAGGIARPHDFNAIIVMTEANG